MHAANGSKPYQVLIVGGGTAGWLTACILAKEHQASAEHGATLQVQLIESPDIATIGVGEGSWPSMRQTLQKIGIDEAEFFRRCDASPKQGSLFQQWRRDERDSFYLHPFTVPFGYPDNGFALQALAHDAAGDCGASSLFARTVTPQAALSLAGKAPKTIGTPDYQFMQNYGYHLNATKFAHLLQEHATEVLGVCHIADRVTDVHRDDQGQIGYVQTAHHGALTADFYLDCSGTSSLLLGQCLQEPFVSCKHWLANDRALALQLPYSQHGEPVAAEAIYSNTVASAQAVGWIWDISLPTRCGIGHVYASDYVTDEAAYQQLLRYATRRLSSVNATFASQSPSQQQAYLDSLMVKGLTIKPGHYQRCMVGNCMAIGMAAGFIEPLEASALALAEWSAKTIAKALPLHPAALAAVATKINTQFAKHWVQIIDFLKLHYVLTERDEPYWQAQKAQVPASLQQLLDVWQYQLPDVTDFPDADQLFPAASYSYVLFGMGFKPQWLRPLKANEIQRNQQLSAQLASNVAQLQRILPSNMALMQQLQQQAFSRR